MARLVSSQLQVDAILEELMQRHEYDPGSVDLTNVAPVMLQLRETLPPSYCERLPSASLATQTPRSWLLGLTLAPLDRRQVHAHLVGRRP